MKRDNEYLSEIAFEVYNRVDQNYQKIVDLPEDNQPLGFETYLWQYISYVNSREGFTFTRQDDTSLKRVNIEIETTGVYLNGVEIEKVVRLALELETDNFQ